MSFGSAACLRASPPQMPLSPNRTVTPFTTLSSGACAPPRYHARLGAAGLPPRGRILVIANQASTALALQKLLRDLGYRVIGPAGSASEAFELLKRLPLHGPIDCALLSADVDDSEHVAAALRQRSVPLAWLTGTRSAAAAVGSEPVLHNPDDRDDLLRVIQQAMGKRLYVKEPPQQAWPRVFPQL